MGDEIRRALDVVGLPNYFVTRGSNNTECIVYNYTSTPCYYADNTLKGTEYTILLNIYTKDKVEAYKKQVLEAMRSSGFKGGNVGATVPEYNMNETDFFYNTAITFKGFKRA